MIDDLDEDVEILLRHHRILDLVIENEPIGIVRLSNETGHPHHQVRYSLRVLQEANLIEPSPQGAVTTGRTATYITELDGRVGEIVTTLDEMKTDVKSRVAQ